MINKIVITGGPCAGKTTAIGWIKDVFIPKGYTVLVIPEVATDLISSGIAPWTCGTRADFQMCQMKLQMQKERVFEQAALSMKSEKILIVCDRGILDNKAYMDEFSFKEALRLYSLSEIEILKDYDAVFHLVSAAKGAEEFYTTANNFARKETVSEAALLDDKLICVWRNHSHFRVIDNSFSFQEKMQELVFEIARFLGENLD